MIGLVLMMVIVSPVVVIIIAAIFSAPRTFRVPALLIGELVLLTAIILLAFAAFSALLGFIVPG
jgi:hypothetical protein